DTFARLVADPTTRTPLVIGVSGKWGSGKSTLLKRIQAKLEETRQENLSKVSFANDDEEWKNFRRCRTVWFNAWKYADEEKLLVALIRVIVQTMYADDFISKVASQIFDPAYPRRDVINTVLGWFAIKTPFGDVKPNTGEPKETPFAEKAALLDLFSEAFDGLSAVWVHRSLDKQKIEWKEGVLVVLIDDLDRCLPDKAVQVLEAIKLFLDRPGVAFVLAADEDAIRAAIESHYAKLNVKDQRADDYLEKIFQVRFPLPPLSATQARNYLAKALDIQDVSLTENDKLISAVSENNPRQIKTFVNYLEMGWSILQNSRQAEGVDKKDFLFWLALTRVGPKFCTKVEKLPKDVRLQFIGDAANWANGSTEKAVEYEEWSGYEHRRLRDVLKLVVFSSKVTPSVLQGFIYWSAPSELEPRERIVKADEIDEAVQALRRQAEAVEMGEDTATEEETKRQTELEAKQLTEEEKRRQRAAKEAELLTERRLMRAREKAEAARRARYRDEDYWIPIPAGKFVMGSRDDNKLARDDEHPQHTIDIPYTYRIARYPVTNAEFAEFIKATGHKSKAVKRDLPDHPVVNVSWHEAQAYCKWLTEKLRADGTLQADENARLPTEAEWEKAARGEYGREWPWGDEWDPAKCNSAENGPGTTTPVGQYSPQGDSPYGVVDMAGNVWEWCQSKYAPYPYKADDGREELKDVEALRVVRGGSWDLDRYGCRAAVRLRSGPAFFYYFVGFRAALSP
ncbi:MAG TPA: SUMF1/EgtB/PvdO family nonheme iron enzyme, partial [Anaerolineales bacterium]|nr:SUMF1/EgtB/PvdO family nonheme iron enzyme [Anaerolineales bacterium]